MIDKLSNAINLIRQHCSFLFDNGFVLVASTGEPKGFGYWQVILRSEKLTIKIWVDRGQLMMCCGSGLIQTKMKKQRCFDLEIVIRFLNNEPPVHFNEPFPLEIGAQMERLMEKLKTNYNKIIELFNPDVSPSRQKELEIYSGKVIEDSLESFKPAKLKKQRNQEV